MLRINILLAIVFSSNLVLSQEQISIDRFYKEFHILKTTLEELHPDLYRYTSKKEFDQKGDSILASVNSNYDPIQMYLAISPYVTQIKNGHTSIRPPIGLIDSLSVLPFRLIALEGKVYVNKFLSAPDTSLAGYEIKSINGIPVVEIVNKSMQYVSVDGFNDYARFKAVVEDDLALYYGLIYGGSKLFKIIFVDLSGSPTEEKVFDAITYKDFLSRYDQREPFPWSLERFDSTTVLLTVRTFNNTAVFEGKNFSFAEVIDGLFEQIKKLGAKRLILDIRFNGGGELKNSILLYRYLAESPFQFTKHLEMASLSPPTYVQLTNYDKALRYAPINSKNAAKKSERVYEVFGHFSQVPQQLMDNYFKGKLIVLINGNTASAAGALASCVKNDKRGLIVGEENRDNYTGFSAGVPVILTLPYSRITVSIPIRKFTYALGRDNGRGVMPDYFYASAARSFFRPQEECLDFLKELFK